MSISLLDQPPRLINLFFGEGESLMSLYCDHGRRNDR
jgi:hypothetical protein